LDFQQLGKVQESLNSSKEQSLGVSQLYELIYLDGLSFFYNQYFVVREFHPGDVVDIMKGFTLAVNVRMSMVFEPEFFLFQDVPVYFYLDLIFAQ